MMFLVFLVGFGLGSGTTFMFVTYVMTRDLEEIERRKSGH